MKTLISPLLLLSLINFLIYGSEIVKLKTVKIKCRQMSCEGCKKTIGDSLKKINGVKKINIDLTKKIIIVSYEDTLTNEQEILNAITETGYEAEIIE